MIEALSEVEEETVLHWRDTAMVIPDLEMTSRVDDLNSMRIENFREVGLRLWTCRVRVKRSGIKGGANLDRLAGDQAEWRD